VPTVPLFFFVHFTVNFELLIGIYDFRRMHLLLIVDKIAVPDKRGNALS